MSDATYIKTARINIDFDINTMHMTNTYNNTVDFQTADGLTVELFFQNTENLERFALLFIESVKKYQINGYSQYAYTPSMSLEEVQKRLTMDLPQTVDAVSDSE